MTQPMQMMDFSDEEEDSDGVVGYLQVSPSFAQALGWHIKEIKDGEQSHLCPVPAAGPYPLLSYRRQGSSSVYRVGIALVCRRPFQGAWRLGKAILNIFRAGVGLLRRVGVHGRPGDMLRCPAGTP